MTDPLRDSYVRAAQSIARAYPLSNRAIVDRDGYATHPDTGERRFLRPIQFWTRADVAGGKVPADVLDDLYDMAADGYYDVLCQYVFPGGYAGDALAYVEDLAAGTGRELPQSYYRLRDMIQRGQGPAVNISAAEPEVQPASAEETSPPAAVAEPTVYVTGDKPGKLELQGLTVEELVRAGAIPAVYTAPEGGSALPNEQAILAALTNARSGEAVRVATVAA